ncbi:MAG: PHB depolymerase family esterase [Polyangiaceae bacterium]|nr:PHB depolymerase family esterase [Polyangiaceae bacterium]
MRTAAALSLPTLSLIAACSAEAPDATDLGRQTMALSAPVEVTGFGSNPGALKMYKHVPAGLAANAPLVLVLHGCTQGAADAAKFGFDELADANGFAVVYPEQQTANNSLRCFNWAGEFGNPQNLQRGQGENLSLKQMVDKMIADHGTDPKRVFVAGFSAGGAEAVLAAATWPDVFAGAASLSGIPYNCTTTYIEVSGCQKPGKDKTAQDWGDRVRAAYSGYAGPWPRMSVWQGSADNTVGTLNRSQIVRQWTNLQGIAETPSMSDTVDGAKHDVYKDGGGKIVVESYEIPGMDHGVPVVPGSGCGVAGSFAFDKGICAAKRVSEFFGIVGGGGSSSSSSSSGASGSDGGSSGKASSSSGGSSGGGDAGGGGGSSSSSSSSGGNDPKSSGSTCSMHPSSERSFPWLATACALGLALVLRRRGARKAG